MNSNEWNYKYGFNSINYPEEPSKEDKQNLKILFTHEWRVTLWYCKPAFGKYLKKYLEPYLKDRKGASYWVV